MQEPQDPGSFQQPREISWGQGSSSWPFRLTIAFSVAVAAFGIPALSLHLDDINNETIVMLEQAEMEASRKGSTTVRTPTEMKAALDSALTTEDRSKIQRQLGFSKDMPPAVVEQRLQRYAADFKNGRFDRVPDNVKELAIKRVGLKKLLALKDRLMQMNLSKEQMIEYAKRELKGQF